MTKNGDAHLVTIPDIRKMIKRDPIGAIISTRENWYANPKNARSWEENIETGRLYMAGKDCSMARYLDDHSSKLDEFQKTCYMFAVQNQTKTLSVDLGRVEWDFSFEMDHVVIAKPYHDKGGEHHWISKDGITKLHVNED